MQNTNMNYDNAANESLTDIRRRYPKDTRGVKDEWRAVIKHQTEINELLAQREKELKGLKQQELVSAYDQKLQDLIKAKEYEIMVKQRESQDIQQKIERYQQDVMRQKEDKQAIKQHLAEDYDTRIMTKAQLEQYQRDMKLQEEKVMIEEALRRQEEAKRRALAKQQDHYQIFNEEIRRAQDKNHKLLEDKIQQKLEYRDLIQENEKKQILKEENYKNFFKLSLDNQKYLMDLHAKNVLVPHIEKERGLDNIVEKRIDEVRERQLAEEIARRRNREDKTHQVGYANRGQIDEKNYAKHVEKIEKSATIPERLRQAQEYDEFLKSMKAQKQEKQRTYKEFLDKQAMNHAERELINKMTREEKKINFGDLQAYKGTDSKLFSLVPGFINSKYAHPLGGADHLRSPGKTVTEGNNDMYASGRPTNYESSPLQNSPTIAQPQVQAQAQPQPQVQATQNTRTDNSPVESPYPKYQPDYRNAQSLSSSPARERLYEARQNDYQDRAQPGQSQAPRDDYRQQAGSPTYTSSSPQFAPSNTYGGFSSPKQSNMYAPENHRSMADMSTYFKKPHNPITNPLPVNVQNPYIAKEMNRVIQRPYFANMASNNLIG